MKHREVDVAVIGAGTAGMTAYRELKKLGKSVVLIEGGPYGTTCARVGCMPSKLLIASAEAAQNMQRAPELGVNPSQIKVDGKAVMKRLKAERDRFVGFVVEDVEGFDKEDRVGGYAHFVDASTLQVDDHTRVSAKSTIIATGSTPFVPDMFKGLGDRLLLNDDVFDWDDLPESVAVFGAGVIGLELGQALSHLGVRVHLFGRGGRVGALTDPEVTAEAADYFKDDFAFQPDAKVDQVEREGDSVTVRYSLGGERISEKFEYVLVATGRRPNLERLELQNLGVELDDKGMLPCDSNTLQIKDIPVFLAGDVNNDRPLLHEAVDEGKIAAYNAAFYPRTRPVKRRTPLSIVFTHPQIAMVGRTLASLPESCTAMGEVSFKNQGRSRVMLQNHGKLRIYADYATGNFLGAEMFGPRAEHLAHLLAWAHQQDLTISQMLDMPFYHPVIEEGLRTALRHTAKAILEGPPDHAPCFEADITELTG